MEAHRHRTSVVASDVDAITISTRTTDGGFAWSIANSSQRAVTVHSVSAVCTLTGMSGRVRMFRNGWQSWSETAVATLGVDTDPARTPGTLELLRMTHHPDSEVPPADHLRSEMATVISDDRGGVLAGFLGGDLHDGTIWLAHGRTGQELRIQAYLGGAELAPGEQRELHEVRLETIDDANDALAEWAKEYGRRQLARTRSAYQLGWCSWYHYFEHIREVDLRSNLAAAADWPIELFQLDDGFQSAVGDWLTTADTFPSGLAAVGSAIDGAGLRPGIWLAPFLVAPDSELAQKHPDWIARFPAGDPLIAMYNDHWGGFVHTLDVSHPEVQAHLEGLARSVVEMGFTYLKLDFTYAPAMAGLYHDRSMTPAQRVRAGYDAIRRGAGPDAFLLGCGAPLGATVGVVDGMRIGPDVAPWWTPRQDLWDMPGYMGTIPATVNAWRNTFSRSFMHRRLWANDPDCLMLRHSDTDLNADQVRAWAMAVAVSGGLAVISDDLTSLDRRAEELLDEVAELGRRVDAAALDGEAPRCDDLMVSPLPTMLTAADVRLEGDPAAGSARLVGVGS